MESDRISKTYRSGNYLRLSRSDTADAANFSGNENQQSNSIENQRAYIREFLKTRPEIESGEFYVDDGFSGVSFERPAFLRMMQDIREGKINCIIVKDLSRFGRNYIEAGKYIERLFPLLGVRFIAINDNYDSAGDDSGTSQIILPFKNLVNDAYCRDISIKIRSHLDVKRKRGEFTGAFPVYGYRRGADKNRLLVDDGAAGTVRDIFRMKIEGMSPKAIAEELNSMGILSPAEYKKAQGSGYRAAFQTHSRAQWTAVAVMRILSNEVYTGTLVQGKESTPNYKIRTKMRKPEEEWIRVENAHEAVIPKADFEVVAEIMKRDTRAQGGKKLVGLYSGYLRCADCGCSMVRTVSGGPVPYVYYICSGHKKDSSECSCHRISETALNAAVAETVRSHLKQIEDLQESIRQIRESSVRPKQEKILLRRSAEKREEIKKFRRLKTECYEDYRDGVITQEEYLLFRKEFSTRIAEGERVIRELGRKAERLPEEDIWSQSTAGKFFENGSMELSRAMLVRLVSQIYVYEDRRIEIMFRYQDEMEQLAGLAGEIRRDPGCGEVV